MAISQLSPKFLLLSFLLLTNCTKTPTDSTSQQNEQKTFAPNRGEKLFILGQANEQHLTDYLTFASGEPNPAGFAFYTSLSGTATQSDMARYLNFLEDYPYSALQLGVWTGEIQWGRPGVYLDEVIDGKYDANIQILAEACKQLNRPIYLRFGYEFDGAHNAYPPEIYKEAYRYFVDKMREHNVENVSYVWHSWGTTAYYDTVSYPDYYPEISGIATQELWYPGDEYVDWVGLSIFGTGYGNLNQNQIIQYLINFAENHAKPVMLAETAAIKTTNQSDSDWSIPNTSWFENVFSLIENNDVIRAFTYINVDWEGDNPTSTWGDTRIQASTNTVQNYWRTNLETFIFADDNLYSTIGFSQ